MAIIENVEGLNNTMYQFRSTENITLTVDKLIYTDEAAVYDEDKYTYSTNSYTVPATVIDKPDKNKWRGANGRDDVPYSQNEDYAKVVIWLRDLEDVGLEKADVEDIKRIKIGILGKTYNVESKKDLRDFGSSVHAVKFMVVR